MSSGIRTDKAGIEAQMDAIGISQEHFSNVELINGYFDEHKINQLFNVRPKQYYSHFNPFITRR